MSDLSFSSSDKTQALGPVAAEFYEKILFDEEPLFVSDEASIWALWMGDTKEMLDRCSTYYGVPVSMDETHQPFWKFVTLLNHKRDVKKADTDMASRLHTELWTSWASLLRSYAAAHGLNSTHHAVVEVSANDITLRVNDRWLRFTASDLQHSGQPPQPFTLNENGTVTIDHQPEQEMDIAAEQFARDMLHPPQ